jgi:hypothetical protein
MARSSGVRTVLDTGRRSAGSRGDDRTTWCIYDAPSPEAIRAAAGANALPVDEIHRVSVLDPFFYAAP